MVYLVTGGTGGIGSYIVRSLVKEEEQVVIYDLFPDESFLRQLLTDEERIKVKIVRGDIIDLPHLIHTAKENHVEKIIHMASLLVETATANPHLALKVISEGTLNIFEMTRILELKKVVWASSVAVFGPPEKYAEEYIPNDALYYPWGVYGACKALNESMAVHYCEHYGLDILALRYSFVYGAGQVRGLSGMIVKELVLNPAVGKAGRVLFGDATLAWLYASDAARATVLAANVDRTRTRAFTIGGDLRPIKEAADYVRGVLPNADITLLPGSFGIGFKFETTPIQEEIGYRPMWSMEQGLKETINIVRQQHGLPLV